MLEIYPDQFTMRFVTSIIENTPPLWIISHGGDALKYVVRIKGHADLYERRLIATVVVDANREYLFVHFEKHATNTQRDLVTEALKLNTTHLPIVNF